MNSTIQNKRLRTLISCKSSTFLILVLFLASLTSCEAQPAHSEEKTYTRADTLRGALRAERTCYDVIYYDLNVKVIPDKKAIEGSNKIVYKVENDFKTLQIDLFRNMEIEKIESGGTALEFRREYDAVFVEFPDNQAKGTRGEIEIFYYGKPIKAQNAPWDGGFVWRKDDNDKDWIGIACEGIGASLWWPNKDHLSDEPDSMRIRCAVPDNLVAVANGNLEKTQDLEGGFRRYDWLVSYPINNYNVSLNIGDYINLHGTYTAADGDKLDLDYYVLSYNRDRAAAHFEENVPDMLACFEQYFGKYPFWRDGYALVETPYLGMEHQSGIAYGNDYQNGYNGRTMAGLEFDNLLIHETGHEYFGNSISAHDHAELWIHEGFTVYLDALYVECRFGYEDALKFYKAGRSTIRNAVPLVGPLHVNYQDWNDSDIYYKGAWILHTLRNIMDDDEKWFALLRSFYEENKLSVIDSQTFIDHVNQETGKDYTLFFDQYLHHARIPELQYNLKKRGRNLQVKYRLQSNVEGLEMPVKIGEKDNYTNINATSEWQTIKLKRLKKGDFHAATELYYIRAREITSYE